MRSLPYFLLFACISCAEQDHAVWKFYPAKADLKRGVVSKYYEHYLPDNPNEKKRTDISYAAMQLDSDTSLMIRSYNAGFQLRSVERYIMGDSSIQLDSFTYIYNLDTSRTHILKPTYWHWGRDTSMFQRETYFSEWSELATLHQQSVRDTLVKEGIGKSFHSTSRSEILFNGDTIIRESQRMETFVKGLGVFHHRIIRDDWKWEVELVEQMPLSEFEKQSRHNRHRVAYIDPEKTLDAGESFTLCSHELSIADYYNSDDDKTGYIDGKKAMVRIIEKQMDANLIPRGQMMLTYRFVVNCEGEAGRFVAQGFDESYEYRDVAESTIIHFYEILSSLKGWNPCVVREEARDAYFYITLKFDNGKLVDVLP